MKARNDNFVGNDEREKGKAIDSEPPFARPVQLAFEGCARAKIALVIATRRFKRDRKPTRRDGPGAYRQE